MPRSAIVVGAGLAGLTTADRLIAGGWRVIVLEASSRVGGRTFTRHSEFADGQYAEAGAEWVDTVHHRIHALVDRFDLALDPTRTTWTAVRRWLFRAGTLHGPEQLREIAPTLHDELDRFDDRLAEIAAGIADASHPELHPQADLYDSLSVADLIEELQLGELARVFATRNMQGEFAAEPSEVSLLFIAQQRAVYAESAASHGDVEAQRLLGGVSQLTTLLADSLPPATVRLEQPVIAIETTDRGVRVFTDAEVFSADHVVVACSLIALRAIRFDPGLPAELADAVNGLGYGTVTKTALQYPRRTWPAGYATTEGSAQRVYEPTEMADGDCGILMAYTGGAGGRSLGALAEKQRMQLIEASQREMYPDLSPSIGGFSQAWSAEPHFGGSYAVYRPGEIGRFWRSLRQPHGRIHVAGEHAATWTGYLEGAVESGEVVAARLLATD